MAKQKSAQKVDAVAESDAASLSAVSAEVSPSDVGVVIEEVVTVPAAWRVVKTTRAHLFGQSVLLAAGKVLTLACYGTVAIERLKDQGVGLEPV